MTESANRADRRFTDTAYCGRVHQNGLYFEKKCYKLMQALDFFERSVV